jgi:hypothetical protein
MVTCYSSHWKLIQVVMEEKMPNGRNNYDSLTSFLGPAWGPFIRSRRQWYEQGPSLQKTVQKIT